MKNRGVVPPRLDEAQVQGRLAALQQWGQQTRQFVNMSPTVMEAAQLQRGRQFAGVADTAQMYAAAKQQLALDDFQGKRFLVNDGRQVFRPQVDAHPKSQARYQVNGAGFETVIEDQQEEQQKQKALESPAAALDQTTKQLVTLVLLGAGVAALLIYLHNE